MTEKDRLGDKLRDKGKAAEDLFIAEQERKRLERVKGAVEKNAATGRCPRDGDVLVAVKEREVTIDVCPTCRGIWLDKGELQDLLKAEDEAGVTRWVRSLLER